MDIFLPPTFWTSAFRDPVDARVSESDAPPNPLLSVTRPHNPVMRIVCLIISVIVTIRQQTIRKLILLFSLIESRGWRTCWCRRSTQNLAGTRTWCRLDRHRTNNRRWRNICRRFGTLGAKRHRPRRDLLSTDPNGLFLRRYGAELFQQSLRVLMGKLVQLSQGILFYFFLC